MYGRNSRMLKGTKKTNNNHFLEKFPLCYHYRIRLIFQIRAVVWQEGRETGRRKEKEETCIFFQYKYKEKNAKEISYNLHTSINFSNILQSSSFKCWNTCAELNQCPNPRKKNGVRQWAIVPGSLSAITCFFLVTDTGFLDCVSGPTSKSVL